MFSILDARTVVQEVIRIMKFLFQQHAHKIQELEDEVVAVEGKTIRNKKRRAGPSYFEGLSNSTLRYCRAGENP